MSETTVHFDGYYVDCLVKHFIPYMPVRWGATPEDSDPACDHELDFDIIRVVAIHLNNAELPTLDDIEVDACSPNYTWRRYDHISTNHARPVDS